MYFKSITDQNGFIHSIDNCILFYNFTSGANTRLLEYLRNLKDSHNVENEYWERLNCKPCSKWQYFSDIVHLCSGIYISIGKFNFLKDTKEPFIVSSCKLEVNLNKHFDKPIFSDLNQWLKDNSYDIKLVKYDYAIDINKPTDQVQNIGTRKERGLYKGTRYYGQRNKNGYCKIYDKQKESGLTEPLTRVEHTIVVNDKKSFEPIYYADIIDYGQKATATDICIINMIRTLQSYGEDIEQYISNLGRTKKETILNLLGSCQYKKLEYDQKILDDLLQEVKKFTGYNDLIKPIYEDANGFIKCDDIENLPFE